LVVGEIIELVEILEEIVALETGGTKEIIAIAF
jgi:hypothetical protein